MRLDGADLDLTWLEPELAAAPAVRRAIEREFPCLGDATFTAGLVATELFVNAVVHGSPPVRLRASAIGDRLRLEVEDAQPNLGEPRPDSRGLRMVEGLAAEWGVAPTPDGGKAVFADIEPRVE